MRDSERAMIQEIRRLRAAVREVEAERNSLQERLCSAIEEIRYQQKLLNGK